MKEHQVALWAGIVAFFSSLLAIGVLDALNPAEAWRLLSSFIIAFITAGSVYAKQRFDDAKQAQDEKRKVDKQN